MSKLLTTKLETFKNYVGGNWMDSSSNRTFKSINPSNTDDIVGIFQASNEEDVKVAIETANTCLFGMGKYSTIKTCSYFKQGS